MSKVARSAAGTMGWCPIVDVSGLSVSELVDTDDPILNRVVRQVIQSLDDPNGVISAFQSFPATPIQSP